MRIKKAVSKFETASCKKIVRVEVAINYHQIPQM
jgi:hypothetical protein